MFYVQVVLIGITLINRLVAGKLVDTASFNKDTNLKIPISGHQLLEKALDALGGAKGLKKIDNLVYEVPTIYRTQSTMQNYNMLKADVYIASSGSQTISFSFSSGALKQRIDRLYTRSEYWLFGQPKLDPIEFSLVIVDDTNSSFACYVKGNDNVFLDPTETLGYVEQALVRYLKRQANIFSPQLLLHVKKCGKYTKTHLEIEPGVHLPAVYDASLQLTIGFDPRTYLPYILRTNEDHYVLGQSTTDVQLTNYTTYEGILFPQRFLTIFNNESVLEDFLVENVELNVKFPTEHFEGLSNGESKTSVPPNEPTSVIRSSQSEVEELYRNLLWNGPYTQEYANIEVARPVAELTKLWHLMFPDTANYENLVMEFDDAVIVLDAPPHQSKLILEWVKRKIGKRVTHLWVTHHHRDHSGGAADFIADGALLVIPQVAKDYWKIVFPHVDPITYNDTHPFVHFDSTMQVRFLWQKEAVHALDWSYAIVTSTCPGPQSGIVAFEADAWSPGTNATRFDMNFARQWLAQVEKDGLSRNASVVAAHGRNKPGGTPLKQLIEVTGYSYPNLYTGSWRTGGGICLKG